MTGNPHSQMLAALFVVRTNIQFLAQLFFFCGLCILHPKNRGSSLLFHSPSTSHESMDYSPKLTANAPENRPGPERKRSSSNHHPSIFRCFHLLLVSGRVLRKIRGEHQWFPKSSCRVRDAESASGKADKWPFGRHGTKGPSWWFLGSLRELF